MLNDELWLKTVAFHGHICPGVAVGYKASRCVLELFGCLGKTIGETHYAIVENDVCGIDGVQFVTGCTLGNDSLIVENQGKFAFSWVGKKNGSGFRLLLKVPLWLDEEPIELHKKVKLEIATLEEKQRFMFLREKRGLELYQMTNAELFQCETIARRIPGKPRLHSFVKCWACNESFMKPWAVVRDGQILCSGCAKLREQKTETLGTPSSL